MATLRDLLAQIKPNGIDCEVSLQGAELQMVVANDLDAIRRDHIVCVENWPMVLITVWRKLP